MEHIKRTWVVVLLLLASIVYIYYIGVDNVGLDPIGVNAVLVLKLSFAILLWYILRKTISNGSITMDWKKPIKEVTIYDVFSILSFVVIILGVIYSYS